MSKFQPSKYQEAVRDFVINGRGHGFVQALAGSGKTSSLVWISQFIKGQKLYAAFNTAIVQEAKEKFPADVDVRTINSLGNGAIWVKNRSTKLEPGKYYHLIDQLLEQLLDSAIPVFPVSKVDLEILAESDARTELKSLVDFVRNTLTDHTNIEELHELIEHYDLDINISLIDVYSKALTVILDRGRAMVPQMIDYNDQLWIPATDRTINPKKFDFILLDEAQDFSKVKLALVKKALKPGGRILAVGDFHQSIFGFAGADTNAVDNIISTLNATVLPLSICYRCDHQILEEARQYVPEIEDRPGVADGIVRTIPQKQLLQEIHEGDLILCRTNAPLLSLCFSLIADGISAQIKGRDIAKNLIQTASRIQKFNQPEFEWKQFPKFATCWATTEINKLLAVNHNNIEDPRIQSINDRVECLTIVWSRKETRSLADMEDTINSIFSDDRPSVWLSSVHRAKGLENDRVFIIHPELLPAPWTKQGTWHYSQELNLTYISRTRAKHELVYVLMNK